MTHANPFADLLRETLGGDAPNDLLRTLLGPPSGLLSGGPFSGGLAARLSALPPEGMRRA